MTVSKTVTQSNVLGTLWREKHCLATKQILLHWLFCLFINQCNVYQNVVFPMCKALGLLFWYCQNKLKDDVRRTRK